MRNMLIDIAAAHSSEQIGIEELGAILSVAQNGNIGVMTSGSQGVLNAKTLVNTVDADGNHLIAEENYKFRGETVKVLREQFGAGNVLDTYYRVYYLGPDMQEHFIVSEVSYQGGIFGKRVYKTEFQVIS